MKNKIEKIWNKSPPRPRRLFPVTERGELERFFFVESAIFIPIQSVRV